MRIVRFEHDGQVRMGRLDGTDIAPLRQFADMQAIIAASGDNQNALAPDSQTDSIPLSDVKLLAPIVPQRNVMCVGWNYTKHFDESVGKRGDYEVELPDTPTFFSKLPTTVIGAFDDVPLHETLTQKLDWEVELAIIIGKPGRDIREEDALNHVFGYCVANDISARDLQRAHGGQWFKGKSLDGTCPLGPWVLTADELPDPQTLGLQCYVNGTLMQDGHTRQQIFPVRRVIAELSAGLTLMPGDVILTGTPEGIGAARTPPVFLRDGDILETHVDQLGSMKNMVRAGL